MLADPVFCLCGRDYPAVCTKNSRISVWVLNMDNCKGHNVECEYRANTAVFEHSFVESALLPYPDNRNVRGIRLQCGQELYFLL